MDPVEIERNGSSIIDHRPIGHPGRDKGNRRDGLIEAVGSGSIETRWLAIEALEDLGPVEPGVLPALRAAIEDPNVEIRRKVKQTPDAIANQEDP